MKIGVDARSLEGNKTGVGRYLENLLKNWCKEKDVEFVLYFQRSIPEIGFLKSDNFETKIIGGFLGLNSNFVFQHFLLPFELKRDSIDFFFSPFYLRPFFCPVKSAIALHDISYEAYPEWFDGRSQLILRFLSKISAHRANLIFTVSEFSKNEIVRLYGTNPNKIVSVHLAPDSDFVKEIDENIVAEVKNRYGLKKFVLCVGTMFTRRHIPDLIEAFAEFCKKNSDFQLLIVGKNCTYPRIDIGAKILEANSALGGGIIQLDFLPERELRAVYAASDSVVYLSDYEGFGLPLVEAQFFGKPVITSHNTSLVEVGGDSVEFVSENSPENIFHAFENVLLNEHRKEELILKGEKNLQRFDWKRTSETVIKNIKDYK